MTRTRRTALALVAALVAIAALSMQGGVAQATNNHHPHKHGNHHPVPKTNFPSGFGGISLEALLCIPQLLAPSSTGAPLTQSVTGVVDNEDGTYTISYGYTTTRPDGTYTVRSCAFRDTAENSSYNALLDPVVGATTQQVVSVRGGAGSSSITVLAAEGDVVCNRLSVSGTGPRFNDRSNVACIDLSEDELPVGAIGGIGLMALSAGFFAVAYLSNKRRVRRSHALASTH